MSGDGELDEQAGQLARAVFEFMEGIRPKGGVFGPAPVNDGPPYAHRMGATRRPAFTVRDLLPSWEPPMSRFGTPARPVESLPAKARQEEIPEAFRRR